MLFKEDSVTQLSGEVNHPCCKKTRGTINDYVELLVELVEFDVVLLVVLLASIN